jgi:hypothetical protein
MAKEKVRVEEENTACAWRQLFRVLATLLMTLSGAPRPAG